MSQVSRKPVNLPIRKRLKPTVNLNLASRRRKDAKDSVQEVNVTDVPTDGVKETKLQESPSIKNSTLDSDIKNEVVEEIKSPKSSKATNGLNTSYDSEYSFSSLPTVILGDDLQNAKECISNPLEKNVVSSFSGISDVSTVLFNSNEQLNNTLNSSLHCGDEADKHASLNESVDENPEATDYREIVPESLSIKSLTTELDNNVRSKSSLEVVNLKEQEDKNSACSDDTLKNLTSTSHNERNIDTDNDDCVSTVSDTSCLGPSSLRCKRKVSEITKRLSEARREFGNRFCKSKPERSSLRMFDLIFYNPPTNPMKPTSESEKTPEIVMSASASEVGSCQVSEEDADNPSDGEKEEDDNGIPAPRVKVGPNGEIVIDEQSLVIETTQSKKSKQEGANLTVVVDTGSNTTYNTYSKKKRPRSEWNVAETVRFYKALQTLGTDFSLMQTLFPSRTRVDLKLKFKKEEKINGQLIEKALRYPSLFDISELEKEEVIVQKEKPPKKRKKRLSKRSLQSLGFDEDDNGPPLKKKRKGKAQKEKTSVNKKCEKDTGKENLESFDDYICVDESSNQSGNSTDPTPTDVECISSRLRRNDGKRPDNVVLDNGTDLLEEGADDILDERKKEDEKEEKKEKEVELVERSKCIGQNNPAANPEECAPLLQRRLDMNDVQPGSLVILTSECPNNPGYQICNVFMVQEPQNNERETSPSVVDRPEANHETLVCTDNIEQS